jgi:hypothetical protein
MNKWVEVPGINVIAAKTKLAALRKKSTTYSALRNASSFINII